MRWATYRGAPGADRVGVVVDGQIRALERPTTLLGLLGQGPTALAEAAAVARKRPAEVVDLGDVRLLPPVPRPPSVRDFMAFENHVVTSMAALGRPVDPVWYEQPVFYFTNPGALLGARDDVPMAPGSTAWDYEVEVAAILGSGGSDLSASRAEECIAGYVVLVDWSARDLQQAEMAVGLGPAKGKDTATSVGPFLVTPDELADARAGCGFDLSMTAQVNGTEWSRGSWADLSWTFGEMIAYASRGTTVVPGDLIASGTVGTGCILELSAVHGAAAYPWLAPGDVVRIDVQRLGTVAARITAGARVVPLR
jgi:2-keto-4-pentenoate hydratase/2-oxohepta-3-ene-1,7-dioic acid hydratase in catechol pathway